VAAKSRAWVYGRSLPGISSSNPAADIDYCHLECRMLSGTDLCDRPIIQGSPTEGSVSERD
jgi:hypothetical protein